MGRRQNRGTLNLLGEKASHEGKRLHSANELFIGRDKIHLQGFGQCDKTRIIRRNFKFSADLGDSKKYFLGKDEKLDLELKEDF